MRKATLYRYQLPIQTGIVLRKQILTRRIGLIVCLQKGDKIGWGEIAPLPTMSQESLEQAENQVKIWLKAWQKGKNNALEILFPSVAFGLSCALAELEDELNKQANYQSAFLYHSEIENIDPLFSQTLRQVCKLKIGIDAEEEGKRANQLLTMFPTLQLRLDANRQWDLAQAVKFAEKIASENIERIQFIEEPCQSPELSRQFSNRTGIAIAWDEFVREPGFMVKKETNLAAIVIKPTLVGSIKKCVSLIQQTHSFGMMAVISSSLESSLGLTQLARIAQQYTPGSVPGLDTLHLMQHQLLREWHNSTLPLVGIESEFVSEIVL